MADAARTVRHYVSDCLAERHPYDVQKGFAGRPSRDAGKVFDGYVPAGGIDNLLNSLTDASVSDEEHARAVRYLYSHSASQESKVELIQKSVVPSIVSLLNKSSCDTLRHQCFLLLWSLCVLPQGCYPVVRCGGMETALRAVLESETDAHATKVRVAAASVIAQGASNAAGVRWMLRAEDCSEFVLPGVEYPAASPTSPPSSSGAHMVDGSAAPSPAELIAGLAAAMQREPLGASKVALHCATALVHLTSLAPGVHLVTDESSPAANLAPTVVEHVDKCVAILASLPVGTPMTPSLAYLNHLLTVTWNVAMDQNGVELLDRCNAPNALFSIFAIVADRCVSGTPTLLQRTLMGALSALSKLTSVKLASSTNALAAHPGAPSSPVAEGATRIDALLRYLQNINAAVDAMKAGGKKVTDDLVALSKNTVQCIRLASEVEAVRDITHRFLDNVDKVQNSSEGFYLRRQLYCTTKWECEYNASV